MYSHQPENYICPFCLIINGIENENTLTLQSHIVYQTEIVTAFVSSHHFTQQGMNVLVIPNQHHENLYVMPAEFGNELLLAKRIISLAMKDVYRCEGISSRQHNEPAGYQDVWHYHEHLTPRFKNDNLYMTMKDSKFMPSVEVRTEEAKLINQAIENITK